MKMSAANLLIPILIAFSLIIPSKSSGIAVYWGQQSSEGTLSDACATGYYEYVNIAYLYKFGNGAVPEINLAGHCNPGSCQGLSTDIQYCQSLGIKVLISLAAGNTLNSSADARNVAAYLYRNFLSGKSSSRPFGDAVLDGVDFDVAGGTGLKYWDNLARALNLYRRLLPWQRSMFLSASPQCFHPDAYLDAAIKTGFFDYVWIKFYNNPPCDGLDNVKTSWKWWSENVPRAKIFMGLPAAPQAASSGYISPEDLESKILPYIKSSPNYGGLMLWNRYWDKVNEYSTNLKNNGQGLHYSE